MNPKAYILDTDISIPLNRSIIGCIEYLRNHIHFFLREDLLESDSEGQLKSFVELIFLYSFIPDDSKRRYHLDFIREFIIEKIDKIDLIGEFKKNINSLPGLALIEEFCLHNYRSVFREFLVDIVENQKIDLLCQRVPFRVLDLKYSLERAQIKDNLPSYNTIYKDTVLGKGLSTTYYGVNAMYSLTHTFFYVTDTGKNYRIDVDPKSFISKLTALIGDRIMEKDLDILGELVLSTIFLHINSHMQGIVRFALDFIIRNQKLDGSFPAPREFAYRDSYEEFRNNYHTTIVCLGALLCFQESL